MANNDLGFGEMSLPNLNRRNEQLKSQIEGFNTAARGTGGTGANKFDEDASALSRKQIAAETEIQDRLLDFHNQRSETAQRTDEAMRAETANSPSEWKSNPSRFDWPGVDTPR
jgi:hypothetical protein